MASWKCSTWNQVRTSPCQSPSLPWTWASRAREASPTWLSTPGLRRPWPQVVRLLSTGWTLAGLMDGGRRDVNFLGGGPLPGSSARTDRLKWQPFCRFYTGFSPVFSRYNGENGLIGAIRVWECNNKKGSEEYLRETRTCNQIVSQCKVGFHFLTLFFTFSIISTQKLLFSWGPGSVGEQLAEGTGIKVERGHYIMLQARVYK